MANSLARSSMLRIPSWGRGNLNTPFSSRFRLRPGTLAQPLLPPVKVRHAQPMLPAERRHTPRALPLLGNQPPPLRSRSPAPFLLRHCASLPAIRHSAPLHLAHARCASPILTSCHGASGASHRTNRRRGIRQSPFVAQRADTRNPPGAQGGMRRSKLLRRERLESVPGGSAILASL